MTRHAAGRSERGPLGTRLNDGNQSRRHSLSDAALKRQRFGVPFHHSESDVYFVTHESLWFRRGKRTKPGSGAPVIANTVERSGTSVLGWDDFPIWTDRRGVVFHP